MKQPDKSHSVNIYSRHTDPRSKPSSKFSTQSRTWACSLNVRAVLGLRYNQWDRQKVVTSSTRRLNSRKTSLVNQAGVACSAGQPSPSSERYVNPSTPPRRNQPKACHLCRVFLSKFPNLKKLYQGSRRKQSRCTHAGRTRGLFRGSIIHLLSLTSLHPNI